MRTHRPRPIDGRLIDDMVNAYVDWREQCRRVRNAYVWWTAARRPDLRLRFAAYLAELDQEDRAIEAYAAAVTRAAVGTDVAPARPRPGSDALFRAA